MSANCSRSERKSDGGKHRRGSRKLWIRNLWKARSLVRCTPLISEERATCRRRNSRTIRTIPWRWSRRRTAGSRYLPGRRRGLRCAPIGWRRCCSSRDLQHAEIISTRYTVASKMETPDHPPRPGDASSVGADDTASVAADNSVTLATGETALGVTSAAWDLGQTIGPYRLVKRLGQGGMGSVWLAEQTHPVRRKVALKLIKPGMDTEEVVARFSSERQALAMMEHPAIARVYDAGSTPEGRPYFAMEYVEGVPITDYCDTHHMATRRRVELFMLVCDGIQHAHQTSILHRNLKPSNVLVTEQDSKPVPKIIDFGLAKAMESSEEFTM